MCVCTCMRACMHMSVYLYVRGQGECCKCGPVGEGGGGGKHEVGEEKIDC